MYDLREMRRADLLLAFSNEHQVHWQLPPGRADRMQRRDERSLRSLLVDCTAPDEDRPEISFLDQLGIPRRGRPLARINLLHVVHEIQAQRFGCAGIERG